MTEGEARREVAAYGRKVWFRRLTSGSSGNISVRLDDGSFLITPSGASLESVTAAGLVRLGETGVADDARARPTSELPLHLAAYRARPDIACVIHTHPTFSVVWSRRGTIFPRDTVGAMESLGACAWTPYAKNGSEELARLCAGEFARGADVVMMERHGLCAVGASLEQAFVQTDLAEEAARIACYSLLVSLTE